jgi:hypothetical protein
MQGSGGADEIRHAFVDEYGDPNLDTEVPGASTHFITVAILVNGTDIDHVRGKVEEVRRRHFQTGEMKSRTLGPNLQRFERVLRDLTPIAFRLYAVVIDKRLLSKDSGLQYPNSFKKYLYGVLYSKLFATHPTLHVRADGFGREDFMEGFAAYVIRKHPQASLFEKSQFEFVNSKDEPLVQLADIICGALARVYDPKKATVRRQHLLALVRAKALLVDEWPPRHRIASGTGSLAVGSPSDDKIARYAVQQAERFLIEFEGSRDDARLIQVRTLHLLLRHFRLVNAKTYVATGQLKDDLVAIGEPEPPTVLRLRRAIAGLRDHGVLVASSARGYKLPRSVADMETFVGHDRGIIGPLAARLKQAQDQVYVLTDGAVDLLAGDRNVIVRAAVNAIGSSAPEPAEEEDV